MASARMLLSSALRRAATSSLRFRFNKHADLPPISPPTRRLATLNTRQDIENTDGGKKTPASVEEISTDKNDTDPDIDPQKPGPIGGFMRGLMGGQAVAVEDAFIAEAKEQGVEIPPPPPPRRADLVAVKRRKRREEDDEGAQSIRDRIFGRFAGSAFMQGAFNAKERIAERIDESDNPVINLFRNIYDRIFAENEMGMVVREIREEDPSFRISEFLREVETDLIPTILGAYLAGDRNVLEAKCTEEAYAMLNASIRERDTEGIVMDTNILDVGNVELTAGRVLEDSPVLIVSFNTQQINCLRDRGGNIVEGQEDDIRAVYYAWAFVREAEYEDVTPTGGGMGEATDGTTDDATKDGQESEANKSNETEQEPSRPWKLMEMVIRGAHSTI
eukprot:GFKZ01004726.1.p1 GENE.GFKZ01004726.1~~GFKZ01004726.1.p1  ORF type:complete len:390 (-),score=77.63 GFKZ01004726.1:1476-2645(-)